MIPELTTEQRRANLEKAMELRQERADIRRKLGDGTYSVNDVLRLAEAGDQAASGMRAKQLINALPGYGLRRAQSLMKQIGIADSKRVGGLGWKQRAALVAKLDGGAK